MGAINQGGIYTGWQTERPGCSTWNIFVLDAKRWLSSVICHWSSVSCQLHGSRASSRPHLVSPSPAHTPIRADAATFCITPHLLKPRLHDSPPKPHSRPRGVGFFPNSMLHDGCISVAICCDSVAERGKNVSPGAREGSRRAGRRYLNKQCPTLPTPNPPLPTRQTSAPQAPHFSQQMLRIIGRASQDRRETKWNRFVRHFDSSRDAMSD